MTSTHIISVVIYARLSQTAEESVSIERQLEAGRKYADARGWQVAAEFIDDGVSATKRRPEDRPGWRAILDSPEPFEKVIVWKVDRLARRVLDFLHADEALQARGAGIVAVEDPVDMTTAQGRAFATMLAVFAEMEAAAISARVSGARRTLLTSGRIAGGERPWPYVTAPQPDGKGLLWTPVPERAEALRAVARDLTSGALSISGAARRLDAAALPPKSGATWNPASLTKLLRNPVLYGATVYHGALIRNPDGTIRITPEQVVLPRPEWQRLQTALDARTTARGARPERLPLLAGLALCALCGTPLSSHRPSDPKRAARYVCQHRACPGQLAVSMERLDEHVTGYYLDRVGDREMLVEVVGDAGVEPSARAAITEAILDIEDVLTATRDRAEMLALFDRRASLEADLDRLVAEGDETAVTYVSTGETLAEVWDQSSVEERRSLLARDLAGVVVRRGERGKHGLDPLRVRIIEHHAGEAESFVVLEERVEIVTFD